MQDIYLKAKEFKSKFPRTIAWRLHKHAAVVQKHLHENEKVNYVFCGQKNVSSLMINKTCIVAITDERLVVGQKRLLWGYFFTTITPDQYNDFKVIDDKTLNKFKREALKHFENLDRSLKLKK